LPSPIAHALAGVISGWTIDPPGRDVRRPVLIFAAAGMAADLDLLVGAHSGPTHGLGAALIVGAVSWLVLRRARSCPAWRPSCAVAAAYASHTLLDWLGTDSSPPIGIMALWPLSHRYYESPWRVFMAISRRYWLPEFWTFNIRALGRELVILVPLAVIVVMTRRRTDLVARRVTGA
jgi:membrane-bound metal-dependent hydrolase YbcI (DUF457 family)